MASATDFLGQLHDAADRTPDDVALIHKTRGIWLYRRWRDVAAEVGRYAAGLAALGLHQGRIVAFQGEISARMLLVAAAARTEGAELRSLRPAALPDELAILAATPGLAAVLVQERDAVARWSALRSGRDDVVILMDHATPDGRAPLAGVVTLDRLRHLAPRPDRPAASTTSDGPRRLAPTWVEEATDWPGALVTLVERWITERRPLALPEQLGSASWDRRAVAAQDWLASAESLERAADAIRERLSPSRTLAGKLTHSALSRGRSPLGAPVVALIRRRLGLSRMTRIELPDPDADRPSLATRQLFESLGVPVGQVAESYPAPARTVAATA